MGLGVQQEMDVAVEGGMDPVQKRLMFEDEWVAAATFFLFLFLFNENNSFVFFFFVLERVCRRSRRRRRIFYMKNQCVIGYVKKIIAWIISTVLFSFSFFRKGLLLFFINNNV
jgi:hypothetical protein